MVIKVFKYNALFYCSFSMVFKRNIISYPYQISIKAIIISESLCDIPKMNIKILSCIYDYPE